MVTIVKQMDCRIIDASFTLGFCIHRRKYTKLYGWTIEAETSHTCIDNRRRELGRSWSIRQKIARRKRILTQQCQFEGEVCLCVSQSFR
jgi:hypothetical protein